MGWLEACFGDMPDPRTGNATRHNLLEVLTIALVGSICGAESCVDFADFARDRKSLFRDFLRLENGLPSHDTFSRLFRLLDPAAFAACFTRFLDSLGAAGRGVLAIDGKTLRRSFDRAAHASPLHVVTAFACDARLVLGQVAVPEGGNEITAARALLGMLDLSGMLVTGDAIHCQGETARLVAERGGDWLFALKANRPAMLAEVAALFADPKAAAFEAHTTTDADHGPHRDQAPSGLPRRALAVFGSPLPGRAKTARFGDPVHGRGRSRARRADQHRPPLLPLLRRPVGPGFRGGSACSLAHRERPALGARHGVR